MTNTVELMARDATKSRQIPFGPLVFAGSFFAPFAALLSIRMDGLDTPARFLVVCISVVAGFAISLATAVAIYSVSRGSITLPRLAALFALSAVSFIAAGSLLRYSVPSLPYPRDAAIFVTLISMINALSIFWLDLRKRKESSLITLAKLQSLESRIRPHFFFNTLNTVSALIPHQPDQAQVVLSQLATLCRRTFQIPESGMTTLAEELEIAREYLAIEKARFGDRLQYSLPDVAPDCRLPALTLQPLVENAVRHGIASLMDGGKIMVRIDSTSDALRITITNPVEDPRAVKLDELMKEGHSLRIVADRLRLAFRDRARLSATLTENTFQMVLTCPVR